LTAQALSSRVGAVAGESDNIIKQVALVFCIAVAGYAFFFFGDSLLRTRKGPWEVIFFSTNGSPAIRVKQEKLGIRDVTVVFSGEIVTNAESKTLVFRQPKQPLPFGKTKFEDLTYLPGSVAFDFFGHEVELLPRTLYLNKIEHAWENGKVLSLKPEEKLPPEKFYDPLEKKRRFGRKE
jgi:hypothetical protein